MLVTCWNLTRFSTDISRHKTEAFELAKVKPVADFVFRPPASWGRTVRHQDRERKIARSPVRVPGNGNQATALPCDRSVEARTGTSVAGLIEQFEVPWLVKLRFVVNRRNLVFNHMIDLRVFPELAFRPLWPEYSPVTQVHLLSLIPDGPLHFSFSHHTVPLPALSRVPPTPDPVLQLARCDKSSVKCNVCRGSFGSGQLEADLLAGRQGRTRPSHRRNTRSCYDARWRWSH
jgi:hypothetical protein